MGTSFWHTLIRVYRKLYATWVYEEIASAVACYDEPEKDVSGK